jgi:hypothetical protein
MREELQQVGKGFGRHLSKAANRGRRHCDAKLVNERFRLTHFGPVPVANAIRKLHQLLGANPAGYALAA